MALGQLRGPSWETGTPLHCPNQGYIVASGGLEVCDAAHRCFVMKEGRSQIAGVEHPEVSTLTPPQAELGWVGPLRNSNDSRWAGPPATFRIRVTGYVGHLPVILLLGRTDDHFSVLLFISSRRYRPETSHCQILVLQSPSPDTMHMIGSEHRAG